MTRLHLILILLLKLLPRSFGQPDPTVKYHFFCGSSFADIQSDTCAGRQWCPSSSDDECLVPGHTCFANTPCDARLIPDISVPTFSLSLNPEYKDPTDKMFCGTDYPDALASCEANDETGAERHCPNGISDCPEGQFCFIDMPCSYFVMTNPLANPLANPDELEVAPVDLPDPGSSESHYFCGGTFQQAADNCSSQTWCRTGTTQECPNGETCFVSVNEGNSKCEINAIVKAEYEAGAMAETQPLVPTLVPTRAPFGAADERNKRFCGFDWSDAGSNCDLSRFCPGGTDDECPPKMTCQEYTACDASVLTAMPTGSPSEKPTTSPTARERVPTLLPTTAKPSREPTPEPVGSPTIKPTGVPSKRPTYAPLPYGDPRREFWCGLDYFDAGTNCPLKCPSGDDADCPLDLKCMSGVATCKKELGLAPYGVVDNSTTTTTSTAAMEDTNVTGSTTPSLEVESTTEAFLTLDKEPGATKPVAGDTDTTTTATEISLNETSTTTEASEMALTETTTTTTEAAELVSNETTTTTTEIADLELKGTTTTTNVAALVLSETVTTVPAEESLTTSSLPPLEGPFIDENVRIILYGLAPLDTAALSRWALLTTNYFEDFFNNYDETSDDIRSNVTAMSIEISNVTQLEVPDHSFNPLSSGTRKKNLRRRMNSPRRVQDENATESPETMMSFQRESWYRSTLDVLNNDPQFITRRPLETPEYRADYVSYLRSVDFNTYGGLEFASNFIYTDFPTVAPSLSPTIEPSMSPVEPGEPTLPPATDAPTVEAEAMESEMTTNFPTSNLVCNLCRPGQYGVNADIIWDGNVSTCVQIYNYFLTNHNEGSATCRKGQEELSSICCSDGEAVEVKPIASPTRKPIEPPTREPTPKPIVATPPAEDNEPSDVDPTPSSDALETPAPTTTPEIPVEENGLPDASTLLTTYYCGVDWNSVDADCASAVPCPSGDNDDCESGELCIAFTNCGGQFTFVNNPKVEGGGPDPDDVKSTFFCGTSMQFLEMKCDGAKPCPNGPDDCDGAEEGCFAFTGCNTEVDPGSFVGFLAKPSEDMEAPTETKKTFYCGATWSDLDNKCVNGVPEGATACPSGDTLACPQGYGCYAFACGNVVVDPSLVSSEPAPALANSPANDFSVEDLDVVKSTFFCGTSIEEIDADCANAKPCPTGGDECGEGAGCFAFSQCAEVDIDALVDTFGRTDRPTRAPTVPIVQVCDEENKMGVNFGYWQSWSIYRKDNCQPMSTASFDASPYTHVIYSFASIDSHYKLEAWNGTFENEVPLYKEFNTVKQRQSGIKTMIAVGGWTHNDPGPMQKRFSEMAASESNRRTFAQSAVQFMRTYGFDGLDLDWEFPGLRERGGTPDDYDNYVLMVKEIRTAFNAAPEDYALTVALTANVTKQEMGYDLVGLSEHIDYFNLMSYDLWGSWDPTETAYSHTDIRMIDEAVDYMSHFVQKSQIVLGLGSYARTYTMAEDDCLDLSCPFEGPGKAGCEGTDGSLPYFEIADLVTSRKYDMLRFDEESASMVMVTDGNRLISYDNTVSFNKKTDYATENCMAGVMLWAIDMLKDDSNPLSSNNGNSAATGDPSDQSFCGVDYTDASSFCKQHCPSGDSSQCSPGEQCFINTGCSPDNIGSAPPTKCRLCPDPSTQGMKTWLEIEFGGNTTTCGEADMTTISNMATGSDECDAAKESLGSQCCYTYPENPCMLCRTETEFMDLKAMAEIDFDGQTMACMDLSTRLGPESADSEMCLSAQSELWDQCCFNQCKLCEGKGVKWWNEIEFEDEPLNCGELDSVLYANSTAEESEMCMDVLSEFGEECCYTYPDQPCDVCTIGDKKLTLMPAEEVDYENSTYTCAEVNNFVSPFESSSTQCSDAHEAGAEKCCFDRCSLCGTGARLDAEVIVDVEGEPGTCADIEASLFQDKVTGDSENCTTTRTLFYDSCCFEIPNTPCQLCATDQYMHSTTTVEFKNEEITCRSVNNYLMERADNETETCADARAEYGETCCYKTCNICGSEDYNLDWDVYVNYEGEDISCGDFNEIFRAQAVVDGSEQCDKMSEEFKDTCCYTSPTTSCQLCNHDGIFYEVNSNVQVDFNGPTTCADVANFLSRRVGDTENVCSTTQASFYEDCCYDKCSLVNTEAAYPDWAAQVEMDGKVASCLDIDNAIKDKAIATNSTECTTLQDTFSKTCSYSIPTNPCDICPDSDVSPTVVTAYDGKDTKCSDIQSRLASREEADGEKCLAAQESLQGCCFDQCHLCSEEQEIDTELTVYYNGKTTVCSDIDESFNENGILASSSQCSTDKSAHSEQCCYSAPKSPCNICKQGSDYFDVMTTNSITFMNKKQSCSDISDIMFKREEDTSDTCNATRDELFDVCCNTKCKLCGDQGLDSGVKVSHEGRDITCLELDMSLSFEAGSDQCSNVTSKYAGECCFKPPETPCRICSEAQGVDTKAEVFYLGTNTTCDNLSNYLGSREEQAGDTCKKAVSDFGESCCYDQCSLCDDGKADWNTYVTYNNKTIACGDFEWVLRGDNVATGSETCNSVKEQFFEKCCYEPPSTSCNLCQVDEQYLDVSPDVNITYDGDSTTCLNVYNSLFVRASAESEECQMAKDTHAEKCCFTKCKLCQSGSIDASAKVVVNGSDVSCSALELSFAQSVIMDGSDQCSQIQQDFASSCCYTIPDKPCRLCSVGYEAHTNETIDFYGEQKLCSDVSNKLAISVEADSQTCASTKADFTESCCYEMCSICPTGSNLNWEVDIEYNKAVISCGEFDTVIRSNAIAKTSQECTSLQSTYSSPCCYNYATATGGNSVSKETAESAAPLPPPVSFSYLEMPSLSSLMTEGTIVKLEKDVGTKVNAGDTVMVVQSNTGDEGEVRASQDGYVAAVLTGEGDSAKPGVPVALVAKNEADIKKVQTYADALPDVSFSQLEMPSLSSAMTEGTTVTLEKDVGEKVQAGDTVMVVESNTGDIGEIKAKQDGYVAAVMTNEGESVETGTPVMLVAKDEADIPKIQTYADVLKPVVQDSASSSSTGSLGAGPCSLCGFGEISLDTEILFNSVQTSCLEVNNFLATQTQSGSETCEAGKEALHDSCCLQKCDICTRGGIPDWYAKVNVNGNSMTCLDLDRTIVDSQISEGTDQCDEIIDVAAPACCYEPPTTPCNICQIGDEFKDVMSAVKVEYGGTMTTCGEIFNALYSREEADGDTCSLMTTDLGSTCCYDKCSLCGNLQVNAATTVNHDGAKIGCSEFDSYVFASNLTKEGTDECTAFQSLHMDTCCFDIPCNLCSSGDKLYTIKEDTNITYGGTITKCSDVSDFLSQDMSQSNNCLAAQENIFSDCCFQPCEMCPGAGESINWAATTTFNGASQSCTDVYWLLVDGSIELTSPICDSASQLASDCCFKVPRDQCQLCKDENGITYNTRWIEEVTVGGVTKTCGDFNTLLSTQESDSQTCSSAKDEIFDKCCFAGSDALLATSKSNSIVVSDAMNKTNMINPNACGLCSEGQVGITAAITFAGNPSTCLEVNDFLRDQFNKTSGPCASAQLELTGSCCREQSDLKPGETAAFGFNSEGIESVVSPESGNVITPPTDFSGINAWTIRSGSRESFSTSSRFIAIAGFVVIMSLLP